MKQTCNEDYWRYMPKSRPDAGPCGRTYDDVDCSTICPHDPLPPKRSFADLIGLAAEHDLDLPKGLG